MQLNLKSSFDKLKYFDQENHSNSQNQNNFAMALKAELYSSYWYQPEWDQFCHVFYSRLRFWLFDWLHIIGNNINIHLLITDGYNWLRSCLIVCRFDGFWYIFQFHIKIGRREVDAYSIIAFVDEQGGLNI